MLGQRKLFQRLVPGLMHAFIFWGFLALFPTIVIAMIGIVDRESTLPWLGEQGWFALLVDIFAVLVLVGVGIALWIRKVVKPGRFDGSHLGEADLILAWISGIVVTLLLWHAARIALGLNEYDAGWSPVANLLSGLFGDGDATEALERVLVWAHVLLILGFLAYLPRSKHLHIFTAAINVYFGRTRARGRLEPLRFDEDVPEEEMRFGIGTVEDLTWKQMVDSMSCTECGRCQEVCPAWATGKTLSPKLLIMGVRDHLFTQGPLALAARASGETYDGPLVAAGSDLEEMAWDCVTCGACVRECPVNIEHVDHILDLRRHLVMVESRFPSEAEPMLRDVERQSNPWGKPQVRARRLERGPRRARAAAGRPGPGGPLLGRLRRLVRRARPRDARSRRRSCCRRPESTSRSSARARPATATPRAGWATSTSSRPTPSRTSRRSTRPACARSSRAARTASTRSPASTRTSAATTRSCTTRSCSPSWCAKAGSRPAASEQTITYHDSCYLARHNDVLAQPRELAAAVGKPIEMERSGKRTFCCGAGGAHMWMEENARPINEERVREAAATGAETLAVACPFCTVMLDDGVQSTGAGMRVADVATLLAEAVEAGAGEVI